MSRVDTDAMLRYERTRDDLIARLAARPATEFAIRSTEQSFELCRVETRGSIDA